jgi:hypothetical protein
LLSFAFRLTLVQLFSFSCFLGGIKIAAVIDIDLYCRLSLVNASQLQYQVGKLANFFSLSWVQNSQNILTSLCKVRRETWGTYQSGHRIPPIDALSESVRSHGILGLIREAVIIAVVGNRRR